MGRFALFVALLTHGLWACGSPPRTIALVNRATIDCADPVTMTHAGTSTAAPTDEVATLEIDDDTAEVTVESDCALNEQSGPVRCSLVFGEDGTQSIIITDSSTTSETDATVGCPRRR